MGYWPSVRSRWLDIGQVFFLRELAKNERGQYPAILTEQTWSIKDLLFGSRVVLTDLARSGSQSHRAIWVILPARGATHIINKRIYKQWVKKHLFTDIGRHANWPDVQVCKLALLDISIELFNFLFSSYLCNYTMHFSLQYFDLHSHLAISLLTFNLWMMLVK